MAHKVKLPNHIEKRKKRAASKRRKDVRSKRKYYLLICEGEKTEPNYFEALKNDLPRGVLELCQIDIEGTGHNTLSLVQLATQRKATFEQELLRSIDKVWVIFDCDSFQPQDFNQAIATCNKTPDFEAAWTNEAFELWYLLHFHFYNTAISRKQYQQKIEENLKSLFNKNYRYEKNSKNMYALLKRFGNQNAAIKHAQNLEKNWEGRQDFAQHHPCTKIHLLVQELLSLNDELA